MRLRNLFARRQTAQRAIPGPTKDMHELLYLDQVAVESLVTSINGVVPSQYQLRQTRDVSVSAAARLGGKLSLGNGPLPPPVGGDVEGSLDSGGAYSRMNEALASGQITAQAKFNLLRRDATIHKFISPEAVAQANLTPGSLVDCEVRLRANAAYWMCLALDSVGDLGDLLSASALGAGLAEMEQAKGIASIVRGLMAGLAPIEAEGVDGSGSVRLVGTTEESWYWRDPRTVLFAAQPVHVIARLLHSGSRRSWNPMKVLALFGDAVVDQMSSALLQMSLPEAQERPIQRTAALRRYIEEVIADYERIGVPVGPDPTRVLQPAEDGSEADPADTETWRAACRRVDELASNAWGSPDGLSRRVVLRQRAADAARVEPPRPTLAQADSGQRFVEVELLAAYW